MKDNPYASLTQLHSCTRSLPANQPRRKGLYFAIASASLLVFSYVLFVRGVASVLEAKWENSPDGFAAGIVAEVLVRMLSTMGVFIAAVLAAIGAIRRNRFCYLLLLVQSAILVRVLYFVATAKQG